MRKGKSIVFLILNVLSIQTIYAFTAKYEVKQEDIYKGFVAEKIWLDRFAIPKITLSDIGYAENVSLPKDALLSDPYKFQVEIGMERNRPFAVVRIPVYAAGAEPGRAKQINSFTLTYTEEPTKFKNPAAKTTDVATSILSKGTWYKIGITKTGFYKIDDVFIKSLGLNPANVNPAHVRIFGNGGRMLSENNSMPRPSDLLENAVLLNSNGDNVFDNGESVIFYALGPTGWDKDGTNQRFIHVKNLYSDTSYYFITTDNGPGRQIEPQSTMSSGNINVNSFNYYDVHDTDMVNPAGSGKLWYGEQFNAQLSNTTQTFNFDIGAPITCVYCTVSFASTSGSGGCTYNVSLNNGSIGTGSFPTPTSATNFMNLNSLSGTGACGSSTVNVGITFNPSDGTSVGYLNYIELNARRDLIMTTDQMSFRDWQSVGSGNIANFQLSGTNSNTKVFDVTNPQIPVLMSGTQNAGTFTFTQDAGILHEFAAINGSNLFIPKYIETVPNQNLHGMPQADLIIVTYPPYLSQANELADYHRQHDNMRVNVATTTEIYNEFSSGGQDISAIRDFVRMFYKRAGSDNTQMPSYLLLFGGGSYDYKNRLANNHNFVPVFESANSVDDNLSLSSDDFYGFLDDSENIENNSALNVLDIGIGRLPARNATDASILVDKVKRYASPSSLGPWRINTTIVADNGCNDPAGAFTEEEENMAAIVTSASNNLYNLGKVYLDAMTIISTPAGSRSPNANVSINNQVNKGTFWINYIGHGNPTVWAGERILTQDDYNRWNNKNELPFMVTGTCDFGQFDHPQFVSAGEQVVLRKEGGAIVNLTTTKAVYSFFNDKLNAKFLNALFTKQGLGDGKWKTFSDAVSIGKNETFITSTDAGEIANFRKFVLLGDPAITPDFPNYNITFDSIVDQFTQHQTDTIKALGAYKLNGSIRDNNGNKLTGFNGLLYISFFDKSRTLTTISGCNTQYQIQDNLIYKGKVSVTDGMFSFTFVTPKDISYNFGAGKISTYAENGITDAAGTDTTVKIGGFSDHPVLNTEPPTIKPYINDSLFQNGGITGSNTSLFVSFYTRTGINISGSNIGHDLTAVLDGNVETPFILNDHYETAPNTYQRGYVSFPISNLPSGRHTITVKAWDVNNNVGEGTVDFIVVDGAIVSIQQLMNYPNPFSDITHFVFEHNHPDEDLNVQINIFSTSGSFVRNIEATFTPSGSRSNEITWDGTNSVGTKLPSGVYVYRINITSANGNKSSAYQKLVIVQ